MPTQAQSLGLKLKKFLENFLNSVFVSSNIAKNNLQHVVSETFISISFIRCISYINESILSYKGNVLTRDAAVL